MVMTYQEKLSMYHSSQG